MISAIVFTDTFSDFHEYNNSAAETGIQVKVTKVPICDIKTVTSFLVNTEVNWLSVLIKKNQTTPVNKSCN